MEKGFVIAIDGPVAAGKSTISPVLAERLGGFYLWTGAMYRCLAFYCLEHTIDLSNEEKVTGAAKKISPGIDFVQRDVYLEGENLMRRLADKTIASASSVVAVFSSVRSIMVKRQQEIAESKIAKGRVVVAEGRDTGTKEFPDAALKIFLTANPEKRAERRFTQLQAKGEKISFASVLQDILERDKRDTEREAGPLVKEPEKFGYFVVNDTNMTKKETIEMIIGELKRRRLYDSH